MKIVMLGGCGQMGRVTTRDLVQTCNYDILIADRDKQEAKKFAESFKLKRVQGVAVDIMNQKNLVKTLRGSDVVIASIPYKLNLNVMQAALEAGCNYLDLGGLFHMTQKQLNLHGRFKEKNLIAILGCGSTPGTTNIMARYGADLLEEIHEINITFAAYDKTKHKTHLVVPYSMYTVFDEFSEKPVILQDGKLKFVEPLSGEGEITFPDPIGKVTGYYTLHSELATFPKSFRNKGLKDCWFKVTFDKDFVHDIKLLVESGLSSKEYVDIDGKKIRSIDVTVKLLNRLIPKDDVKVQDLEYIRVIMKGKRNGRPVELYLDSVARASSKLNISAGAINTATPPSIIAQMIARGQVKQKGVLPPESCVDPKIFFDELSKRGIRIYQTLNEQVN